jgi:hypothetical protein
MNAHIRASRSCRVNTSSLVGMPERKRFSSARCFRSRSRATASCSSCNACCIENPFLSCEVYTSNNIIVLAIYALYKCAVRTAFIMAVRLASIMRDVGGVGARSTAMSSSPMRCVRERDDCISATPSMSRSRDSIFACCAWMRGTYVDVDGALETGLIIQGIFLWYIAHVRLGEYACIPVIEIPEFSQS